MGMQAYADSPSAVIADVDCTAAGESLCQTQGVQGYPSIKYGDPSDLKDYQGGRDFEALKAFADSSLGPQCGPENLDLCDAAIRKKIENYMQMSLERLTGKVSNAKRILEEDVPV